MTTTKTIKEKNEFSKWKLMREGAPFYIMMAPFMLLFTVFIIIPVVAAIVLSFTDFNMLQMPNFVGVDNYIRLLLKDDIFTKALKNTLVFAVVSGPVGYLMSFVVAWFINELGKGMKNFITLIMYAPTLAGTFGVFLMRQFMVSAIPDAILEAARIDGANEYKIFWSM